MSLKFLFFPMSIMLALVILIWMAKPEWDALKNTQVILADVTDKLANVDGQVSALEEALSQYKSKSADHRLISNAIPFNRHAEDIMAEIYQEMKNSNVLLNGIVPAPGGNNACAASISSLTDPSAATAPASTPIASSATSGPNATSSCMLTDTYQLSFIGAYRDIRTFVRELGTMNRYVDIDSLMIMRDFDPANSNNDVLSGSISVTAYYKAEPSNFQIIQHFNEPAGKVLLGGKIEADVIEKYRSSISSRPFEGDIPTGLGRDNIFQNPNPAPSNTPASAPTSAVPESSSTASDSGELSPSTTTRAPESDSPEGDLASGI